MCENQSNCARTWGQVVQVLLAGEPLPLLLQLLGWLSSHLSLGDHAILEDLQGPPWKEAVGSCCDLVPSLTATQTCYGVPTAAQPKLAHPPWPRPRLMFLPWKESRLVPCHRPTLDLCHRPNLDLLPPLPFLLYHCRPRAELHGPTTRGWGQELH